MHLTAGELIIRRTCHADGKVFYQQTKLYELTWRIYRKLLRILWMLKRWLSSAFKRVKAQLSKYFGICNLFQEQTNIPLNVKSKLAKMVWICQRNAYSCSHIMLQFQNLEKKEPRTCNDIQVGQHASSSMSISKLLFPGWSLYRVNKGSWPWKGKSFLTQFKTSQIVLVHSEPTSYSNIKFRPANIIP